MNAIELDEGFVNFYGKGAIVFVGEQTHRVSSGDLEKHLKFWGIKLGVARPAVENGKVVGRAHKMSGLRVVLVYL